jgi:hypothetical protein
MSMADDIEGLWRAIVAQEVVPEFLTISVSGYKAIMREMKWQSRTIDWHRCRHRHVRTWKGRRFSFWRDDSWMAERGELP